MTRSRSIPPAPGVLAFRILVLLMLCVWPSVASGQGIREKGAHMDTDRLRAILERLREQTEQEQGALSKASGDAAKTPLYSDSLIAAREWVGLRQGRPVMRITHNREAAASSGIDALHENGRSGLNLSGINQMVALFDNGHPRLTHVELSGRIERRDAFSTESSHSTHVAGTIAASGQWRDAMGMAPQARIRSHDWTNDGVEIAEVALEGIRVSNHSYGDPLGWTPNILGDGYWGWMGIPSIS
ncbi:MAG: S8 family serine peptidase, partial [Rhodothermales bacterium]